MNRTSMFVSGGVVALFAMSPWTRGGGAQVASVQPVGSSPSGEILAQATPVEREILVRLDRLDRGLFLRGSSLSRSESDSIERRIENLASRSASAAVPPGDAKALRDIQSAIDQLDRDLEREVVDVLERVERTIEVLERRASREGDTTRRLEELARAIERVDRRLESIERRIR